MTETTVETTVAERPAAHRSEKRQGDGAWTPEASTGRWFAAGWEPAARVVLVGLLAGSLGLAARSVGPAPFAPETREVVVGYLLSMLAAAPALFFARRTLVSNVFLAAPFVLLVENLGSLVDRSAPEHVLLALTGVLLGLAALRIRSPRALAGLSALALFVFGVGRFRPIDPLAASQTPSVLLVVFDTTAAGHVSAYGYSRPTTPNLAGLARRGLVYERAVSAAPWTLPSHGAIFSGRYPSELGFREDGFDPRVASGSIAGDLAASGRPGCAISANPWISESHTLGRDFGAVWDVVHLIKSFPLRVLDRVRHR